MGLGVLSATPVEALGFIGPGVLGGSRLSWSSYIFFCIAIISAIILFNPLICDKSDEGDDRDRGDFRDCSDSDDTDDSSP